MEPSGVATYTRLMMMFKWEKQLKDWRKEMIKALIEAAEEDEGKKYTLKMLMALRATPGELMGL